MQIKKSAFCLLAVAVLALPLVACGEKSSVTSTASSAAGSTVSSTSSNSLIDDLSTKQTLTMSVFYNSTSTMMTFPTGTNYTGANGKTYTAGDFKPVWEQVQKNLNFTIEDKTDSSKTSVADAFTTLQANGFKTTDGTLVNVAQGNSSDIIKEGTTNHTILNLSDYMSSLPNFSAYLEANPIVKKSIVDSSGAIYYAPYFDGADDMEKSLLMRKDWVEKLLDGNYTASRFDTSRKITASYTRYNAESVDQDLSILDDDNKTSTIHKKYVKGSDVITEQNALTSMDGASLVKTLRDYIDTTYNGAYGTKRSELFIGGKASFNIDELVALYRCVKTNPVFLTTKDQDLVPLNPREYTNDRTSDLWNFMQYFGCRGFNSRQTYFYVDDNGVVQDIREQPTFVNGMKEMNAMYKEGLILNDFTSKTGGGTTDGKYENKLFKDQADGTTGAGFSEYDYVQTQTIMNDSSSTGMKLVPTYPAAYAWKDGKESRYTESWRGVKSQGWFITADTAKDEGKLKRALYMFDYFWGSEGSTLMSYGPSAWVDGTTTYKGKSVPKLSTACLSELNKLTSGNYTNYYRQYLGGTFPIGYVKEQGMEYQTVQADAKVYLNIIENALENGVINHPNFKLDNTDHMQDLMPTTLSFTSGEQDTITSNYSALSTYFSTDKKKTNILTKLCQNGFVDGTNYTDSDGYLTYIKGDSLKLDGYLSLVRTAYGRMGL